MRNFLRIVYIVSSFGRLNAEYKMDAWMKLVKVIKFYLIIKTNLKLTAKEYLKKYIFQKCPYT